MREAAPHTAAVPWEIEEAPDRTGIGGFHTFCAAVYRPVGPSWAREPGAA